jgi:hypothetical protein
VCGGNADLFVKNANDKSGVVERSGGRWLRGDASKGDGCELKRSAASGNERNRPQRRPCDDIRCTDRKKTYVQPRKNVRTNSPKRTYVFLQSYVQIFPIVRAIFLNRNYGIDVSSLSLIVAFRGRRAVVAAGDYVRLHFAALRSASHPSPLLRLTSTSSVVARSPHSKTAKPRLHHCIRGSAVMECFLSENRCRCFV